MDEKLPLICVGCGKQPHELLEYVVAAADEPEYFEDAADYVRKEEGTLNEENGHFLCSCCWLRAGAPSSPGGWKAS